MNLGVEVLKQKNPMISEYAENSSCNWKLNFCVLLSRKYAVMGGSECWGKIPKLLQMIKKYSSLTLSYHYAAFFPPQK